MCDIYNLEVNPGVFSPPQANSEVAKIVTELETLNLSAASDVWFEDKEGKLSDKNGKDNADARTTWKKEKEKLNKKPGSDGQPKYKRLPDTWQRKQAASALKRLLKSATDLSNEYSSTIGGAEVRVQRVQTALTNALHGKGKTRLDTAVLTSDLKSYCGKAAGSPAAGKGIAYDFICLCTATDSNSAGECLQGTTINSLADPTNANDAQNRLTAITTACGKPPTAPPLTSELITTRIAAFSAQIGRHTTKQTAGQISFTFGKPHTGGTCDSSSGRGQCINYKQQLGGTSSGIPWITELETARTKLVKMKADASKAQAIEAKIQAVRTAAWSLYDQAILGAGPAATEAPALGTPLKRDPTETEETCEKKGTGDNCKEGCKVEGKGNKESASMIRHTHQKKAKGAKERGKTT
uniref:Variant surface glycoprotein 1125.2627 n=1 Tax=Trypanosoma brucei TaxID=5691 RepID=A0A1J0R897_9TRYP|nr:variant surface glycoprotein 1125.2627 [Trypanosoma brucei]